MSLTPDEIRVLHTHVYSKPTEILAELERRRKDELLLDKVRTFLGEHAPTFIDNDSPNAIFSRPIFTPNLELDYFADVSTLMGMRPRLLQYGGKFVARNPEKYHLAKLHFFSNPGKRGGINFATANIVDFNTYEGQPMMEVRTLWGESLANFHMKLLSVKHPDLEDAVYDFTDWFNTVRERTPHYYFYYFTLFLVNGVLFENFLVDDKEENVYIKRHVLPSFLAVEQHFGVKPLIFPLLPLEHEKARTWLSYPKDVKDEFEKRV